MCPCRHGAKALSMALDPRCPCSTSRRTACSMPLPAAVATASPSTSQQLAPRHGMVFRGLHAPLLRQARCRPIGEGRVGDGDLRRRRRRRGDRDDAARRRAGKGDGAQHAGPPAGRRAMRGRAPPRGPTPTTGPPVQGAAAAGTPGAPRPESCIGACLCARAAETESPSNAAVP